MSILSPALDETVVLTEGNLQVGQSLATLEAVVVLCAVARGIKFEKVGGGSGLVLKAGEERDPEVVTTHRVTAVVGDGMKMKVSLI